MSTTPLVSVCVPTYNGAEYLRPCLDSVLSQSYGNFELLIADDGSTDDTAAICQAYAARDPRVRFERNARNLGLVGNWGRCMELASAPWVKFVFQDDLLRPNGLAALIEVARLGDSPLAFGRREFIFESGTSPEFAALYEADARVIADLFPASGFSDAGSFSRLLLGNLQRNIVGEPVAVLLRKDVLATVGPFHPDIAVFCDMEYWARVATRFGVAHTAEVVADFRVHGTSTTARSLSGARFRTTVLDHVVFQHDMAYAPAYGPLRQFAAQQGISLVERFETTATWARGQAQRMADDATQADPEPLRQLQRLEQQLPRLKNHLDRARRRHRLGQFVGQVKRAIGRA